MTNLNSILKAAIPMYELPHSNVDAFTRAAVLTVITGASYFIQSEETGVPLLDDYIFPAISATLVGLTCASVALAADFYLNHHHAE